MEDSKVPFADTTARRAQLMAATERFKTSISDSVESIKEDATDIGKTTAFVGGAALAVYLVVNAILPKSEEYRNAVKYGERHDEDYDDDDDDNEVDANNESIKSLKRKQTKAIKEQPAKMQKSAAAGGIIGGLITSVLTNIAREQLTSFLGRIRTNNAINSTAEPTQYNERAATKPVDHTSY